MDLWTNFLGNLCGTRDIDYRSLERIPFDVSGEPLYCFESILTIQRTKNMTCENRVIGEFLSNLTSRYGKSPSQSTTEAYQSREAVKHKRLASAKGGKTRASGPVSEERKKPFGNKGSCEKIAVQPPIDLRYRSESSKGKETFKLSAAVLKVCTLKTAQIFLRATFKGRWWGRSGRRSWTASAPGPAAPTTTLPRRPGGKRNIWSSTWGLESSKTTKLLSQPHDHYLADHWKRSDS